MATRMAARLWVWAGVFLAVVVAAAAITLVLKPGLVPPRPGTATLRSASAFEEGKNFPEPLVRGQVATCDTQPTTRGLKHPPLKSAKALYGEAEFDRNYYDNKQGVRYAFAIDETEGTGKGFDRLWFDVNQDGDLTNDPAVAPMKNPPEWNRYKGPDITETVFDAIPIEFDYGPQIGRRSTKVIPYLQVRKESGAGVCFIWPEVRKGEVRIGEQLFQVLLGQPYVVSGRYDRPTTAMYLLPPGGNRPLARWWGAEQMNAMHMIDGRLYRFTTTPLGDTLTVQPYGGDFGVLRVGAGNRKVDTLAVRGSLDSPTCAVAVGPLDDGGWSGDATEASLPVGDYMPSLLNVRMGSLRVEISHNYHSYGKPRDRQRQIHHNIRIRKDRPFVLDFGNKPEVMFACPAKDQVLHPGEEIKVQAVLTDPVLDVMIRELRDSTRKEKKEFTLGDGSKQSYE